MASSKLCSKAVMFSDLKSNRVSYGFWQIEKQTAVSSSYLPRLRDILVVHLFLKMPLGRCNAACF